MVKKLRSVLIISIFVVLITLISLNAATSKSGIMPDIANYPYIEQSLLASSRFTTKEEKIQSIIKSIWIIIL